MKKLNGKLIVSALLAAAMASFSAVSAGAIDYSPAGVPSSGGSAPSTSTVTGDTTTDGSGETTQTVPGSDDETPATVLTQSSIDSILDEAEKNGKDVVVVYMEEDSNGKVTVQESAIAEIANSDVTVVIEVDGDVVDYTVTIDPDLIDTPKAINIAMDIEIDTDEGETVSGVEIPEGSVIIKPQQKGNFGMTLTVTIPASAFAGMNTGNLSLYYVSDNGEVSKLSDSQITVNADGSVSISISHASAYMISDIAPDTDGEDDDIIIEDDDDDDIIIEDDIDTSDNDNGKTDEEVIVIVGEDDANPHTGVALALGALAASAAAVAITAKKRK
jgi:hypothetical protein